MTEPKKVSAVLDPENWCPVTGLPVFQKPEWTDIDLGEGHFVTFKFIGQRILLSMSRGWEKAGRKSFASMFQVRAEVLNTMLAPEEPFFELRDYTRFKGTTSRETRNEFIKGMRKDQDRIIGFIGFGAPMAVRIAINVAKNLFKAPFPVHIVKDYATAIQKAVAAIIDHGRNRIFDTAETISRPDWSLQLDGYATRYEVIGNRILHVAGEGYLKAEYVDPIFEKHGKVIHEIDPPTGDYYIILGVSRVTGGSRRARKHYLKRMQDLYQQYPFKMVIFYGASAFIRAAVNLVRHFMKADVRMVANLDLALNLIRKDDLGVSIPALEGIPKKKDGGLTQTAEAGHYVEELLQYIGRINWETEIYSQEVRKDPAHPFSPVFDAIDLIRSDLDDLFQERRQAEEKRLNLESQLQQSRKMEAIGTLAGGIAHDFNNIMGIVIGNTELALDDIPEGSRARRHLEEIRKAGLRARDVVRQLLSFSRRSEEKRRPVEIKAILKEAVNLLRSTLPTSIDIRLDTLAENSTIMAEPTKIHQIIINLGTNAAHAMSDTGGILYISLKTVDMSQAAASGRQDLSPGRFLHLQFRDTGHGIPPETLDRIFEPYFTTKDIGKGTGMGLSVVHGIVNNHHGAISAESEVGKGTTFNLYFPVVKEGAQEDELPEAELPPGGERILFIDDEKALVAAARQLLKRMGYKVEAHTDPVVAINVFQRNPQYYDLVITDMTMPGMQGDEVARALFKIREDIPIILCTGYSEKIDTHTARELGAREYLEKPLNKRDLAIAIRRTLDPTGQDDGKETDN